VDGVLSVELKYVVPEALRPRKIEIGHYEELTNDTDTKELLTEAS
jgi:hypothetical protein